MSDRDFRAEARWARDVAEDKIDADFVAELFDEAADRIEALEFTIAEVRGLDGQAIAFEVLHHIETMYPIMLDSAPKTARTSIRNTIIQTINDELNAALK